ncbi:MAG: UDP-glucose--hexose-1-phosphate uridylyltransferase [Bacteroides sp.]|nr:UDP-glucose--hexose-1-phosphate uridylyltransferase [Eubacterium sp.]MCM1418551.1 UDP-glucose--hexose-1-phosphate uridylyltransferase [Roseburia sp.]MCM1462606.1 UDP-glucose--hexose-1-phosphate uridylyltransferase [Bacteroides sp.]
MEKTCYDISRLIAYARENGLIDETDEYVARNGLMEALGLSDWVEVAAEYRGEPIDELLSALIGDAIESGRIADTAVSRDLFDTKLMGVLTWLPHEVNRAFFERYKTSPERATDWYYDYSKKLNYVRAGRIARDKKWVYRSEYGDLDITINRSKPEKDPRDIAAAGAAKASAYPKCQLCPENAGFAGHITHPARQNLRPIAITVGGEKWQFQYSPYGYYNEHCIVFNEKHIPMTIDEPVFEKLFDVIDLFPHYFVGSNADLPIVGGSILSHEHFQGGHYTFAMARAAVETPIALGGFPEVSAGIVKWPMSVIRLQCADRKRLVKACAMILAKWRGYSDPEAGIYHETDGVPHNTITPIARRAGDRYECDLVLRNNRTSEDRPLGIFHPNPTLHHIKKENIGLIEVMGLAVLPARLQEEMERLAEVLLSGGISAVRADPVLEKHADWAEGFAARSALSQKNIDEVIRAEIGKVFEQVLSDAGVYKRDESGRAAFLRFTDTLK